MAESQLFDSCRSESGELRAAALVLVLEWMPLGGRALVEAGAWDPEQNGLFWICNPTLTATLEHLNGLHSWFPRACLGESTDYAEWVVKDLHRRLLTSSKQIHSMLPRTPPLRLTSQSSVEMDDDIEYNCVKCSELSRRKLPSSRLEQASTRDQYLDIAAEFLALLQRYQEIFVILNLERSPDHALTVNHNPGELVMNWKLSPRYYTSDGDRLLKQISLMQTACIESYAVLRNYVFRVMLTTANRTLSWTMAEEIRLTRDKRWVEHFACCSNNMIARVPAGATFSALYFPARYDPIHLPQLSYMDEHCFFSREIHPFLDQYGGIRLYASDFQDVLWHPKVRPCECCEVWIGWQDSTHCVCGKELK